MATLLVNAFVFLIVGAGVIFLLLSVLDSFERWFERQVIQSLATRFLCAQSKRMQEIGSWIKMMGHELAFIAIIYVAGMFVYLVT